MEKEIKALNIRLDEITSKLKPLRDENDQLRSRMFNNLGVTSSDGCHITKEGALSPIKKNAKELKHDDHVKQYSPFLVSKDLGNDRKMNDGAKRTNSAEHSGNYNRRQNYRQGHYNSFDDTYNGYDNHRNSRYNHRPAYDGKYSSSNTNDLDDIMKKYKGGPSETTKQPMARNRRAHSSRIRHRQTRDPEFIEDVRKYSGDPENDPIIFRRARSSDNFGKNHFLFQKIPFYSTYTPNIQFCCL